MGGPSVYTRFEHLYLTSMNDSRSSKYITIQLFKLVDILEILEEHGGSVCVETFDITSVVRSQGLCCLKPYEVHVAVANNV